MLVHILSASCRYRSCMKCVAPKKRRRNDEKNIRTYNVPVMCFQVISLKAAYFNPGNAWPMGKSLGDLLIYWIPVDWQRRFDKKSSRPLDGLFAWDRKWTITCDVSRIATYKKALNNTSVSDYHTILLKNEKTWLTKRKGFAKRICL